MLNKIINKLSNWFITYFIFIFIINFIVSYWYIVYATNIFNTKITTLISNTINDTLFNSIIYGIIISLYIFIYIWFFIKMVNKFKIEETEKYNFIIWNINFYLLSYIIIFWIYIYYQLSVSILGFFFLLLPIFSIISIINNKDIHSSKSIKDITNLQDNILKNQETNSINKKENNFDIFNKLDNIKNETTENFKKIPIENNKEKKQWFLSKLLSQVFNSKSKENKEKKTIDNINPFLDLDSNNDTDLGIDLDLDLDKNNNTWEIEKKEFNIDDLLTTDEDKLEELLDNNEENNEETGEFLLDDDDFDYDNINIINNENENIQEENLEHKHWINPTQIYQTWFTIKKTQDLEKLEELINKL